MNKIMLYPEIITTKLSTKFNMHINGITPTITGILTFNNMINISSESLKLRTVFIFQQFSFEVLLNLWALLAKET